MADLLEEYRERREAARVAGGISDKLTTTEADAELYEKLTEVVQLRV